MFYSHEILTSRKHGVATVWLVATLGSKSSLKKVSRRAILDVDVPKACETIADPESPMALRLQSSLLYGVSRVFWQQCGYILVDSRSLHDKMKGVSMVMRDSQVDNNVALTSDQLNLPNDPGFSFDVDMGVDLSAFDIFSQPTERSSLLSPRSFATSQSSLLPEMEHEHELQLPSMDTPGHEFFDWDFSGIANSSSIQRPLKHVASDLEEPGIDEHPFFEINDDGIIVEKPPNHLESDGPAPVGLMQDIEAGTRVETEGKDQRTTSVDIQGAAYTDPGDGFVIMGDDDDDEKLPVDAQPHTPIQLPAQLPASAAVINSGAAVPESAAPVSEAGSVEMTAEAPQRRIRSLRVLQADQVTQFTNRQLIDWQNDYIETMARARRDMANRQSAAQARRSAAFWILDQGIGGVATNFSQECQTHPLAIFSGQPLLESLTGTQDIVAGRKRSYSSVDSQDQDQDQEAEAQRIRITSEENFGRGDNQVALVEDDDGIIFQGDDEVELQMGRQPASSLKDHPSSMPWNIFGSSYQGSLRGSAQPGISSSIQGVGLDLGLGLLSGFSGRRSRLTTASPLFGKGRMPSRLASLDLQHGDEVFEHDTGDFNGRYADLAGGFDDDDFELYGSAAVVSTQQAVQSQWLAATLENEAHNFLLFLDEKIKISTQADDAGSVISITFEDLLPPAENSNIVAAQGLLHVLALATKGLINIQQEEAFGEISLSVARCTAEEADDDVERAGST